MLNNLRYFVEENKKDILTFIENGRRPINLDYDNDIFEKLLRYLVAGFPICHCDPTQSTHAEFDKVHYELAVAVLELFWCGCLSQMKENRHKYQSGTTDMFRQVLVDSFDTGRGYTPIKEIDRQK
ncbi:MAG: hypothetical protein WCC17_01125 [Candidatus Nitrosopolaris sp.]